MTTGHVLQSQQKLIIGVFFPLITKNRGVLCKLIINGFLLIFFKTTLWLIGSLSLPKRRAAVAQSCRFPLLRKHQRNLLFVA